MKIILAKNKNVDVFDKLNQFLSDKQFIKVRYIEDLNTKIYYFKNRPFIILDCSARKICFYGSETELNLTGLEDQVCSYNYLPKYHWFAIKINQKPNLKLIEGLISDCYFGIYSRLVKSI
ncbi:hypothetical protein [Sphingobacterium anhuiense]|uniref:hypothetical protein n=1 Tax=Sphingobacterium anhuiense TaxID=493780 RepID=UPI003C2D3FED